MILTRQERERLVLDLHYNQGKNTREIAQEVKISFKDIGAILKKSKEKETSKEQAEKMSQSTQAYKLFSKDKSPIQVVIELNLRETEVVQYYKEYWKLKQLYDLYQFYEEIKNDISSFVNLFRSTKDAGIGAPQVIRLLAIANNHIIPSVEQIYQELKREEASYKPVIVLKQSDISFK